MVKHPKFLPMFLIAAAACSRGGYESSAYAPPPPPGSVAAYDSPRQAPLGGMAPAAPATSKGRGMNDGYAKDEDAAPRNEPATPEPKPQKARMVHYDGFVKVRVTNPQKTLEEAASMATAMGGFVEQQTDTMVTLRVPVAEVQNAFAKLLKIGDVLSRSLTAQDITDAFTASELRLKTMRASRDRLIALLATVKDENERLQILNEIRRLTEEIDSLDLRVKTLAKLAAFSRLTLETVPREQRGSSKADTLAAFRWMDELSPFRRDTAARERLLELQQPKEMVVLDDTRHWVAESADGAVVWSSRRHNEPQGTSEFWATAIAERLGTDFAETKREHIGNYDFVSFVDGGEAHYRYMIGVRADGDDLETIEIYYPTPDHEKRYAPAVGAAISGGAS